MDAAALLGLKPSSQRVVLQAVEAANPQRGDVAEWSEPQLAARCYVLTGKPCKRQMVGLTLRASLLPKGLVVARKEGHQELVWAATVEASTRSLAALGVRLRRNAQGRHVAQELATVEGGDQRDVSRALQRVRAAHSAPALQPSQDGAEPGASQHAGVCPCARCGRLLQAVLRCPDSVCELAGNAATVAAAVKAAMPAAPPPAQAVVE